MNQSRYLRNGILCIIFTAMSTHVYSHDTTHIHPLITAKIRQLIQDTDSSTSAYLDLYKLDPSPIAGPLPQDQFLYWGTDFDPEGLANTNNKTEYLVKDQYEDADKNDLYSRKNNVIDGVVNEDRPATKVVNHFYQAQSAKSLTLLLFTPTSFGESSDIRAMRFFNQSIELMGYGTEAARQEAFFTFGQALHHVEDMITPTHIHYDAENDLFVAILRCGQLKNTHVAGSTLRFLNYPRLVLKQTGSFTGVNV